MKAIKVIAVLCLVYVGIVVLFESLLGYFQPEGRNTLVITTIDADGGRHSRVVGRLETDGNLYVAANHWPRAWYHQALDNPNVDVEIDGEKRPYTAVPVAAGEANRVDGDHPLGTVFRILTGFPPRYFVRLDPRD
jgi:hypothetical protein